MLYDMCVKHIFCSYKYNDQIYKNDGYSCLLVSLNHADYATLPDVRCEGQYSNITRHTR